MPYPNYLNNRKSQGFACQREIEDIERISSSIEKISLALKDFTIGALEGLIFLFIVLFLFYVVCPNPSFANDKPMIFRYL
jgi:hypothetical protein